MMVEASTIILCAMEKHGLTHTRLAKMAGVSRPTISMYLSGKRSLSVKTLGKLVKKLEKYR